MMDPVISRLSQTGAKGGALAMLAAVAAYAVSRDPIELLVFPMLISIVQLLCLVEGPWTAATTQRLPVRIAAKRRLPLWFPRGTRGARPVSL
jgi:hypothetical protein